MNKNISIFFLFVFAPLLLISCHSSANSGAISEDDAASNVVESAVGTAGAQASGTEGAGTPGLINEDALDEDFQYMDYVDPQDKSAHPETACSFNTARSTCTSNTDTLTWNGCAARSAKLDGSWTEVWSVGFCPDGTKPGALTDGSSVNRKTTNEVLTLASGATISSNTNAHSAWDAAINGNGVMTSRSGGTRTIVIDGIHIILVGPLGRTLFDHSITSTGLTVTGTRLAGTRNMSGTATLHHNLAHYTAVHTFNALKWQSASCCYPTDGTVTTTLSGSLSGTVSMDFSPGLTTCGQATFTDINGTPSTITLSHCR